MTTRPIRQFDDPVLREVAKPVTMFDAELRRLVQDLAETMVDAGGIGLAAPQIGVSLRVFSYIAEHAVQHLVNPVITAWSEEVVTDREGCLSFPELYFPVPRATRVVVKGANVYGDPETVNANLRLARYLQHEVDHLDGILFVDRMDPGQQADAMRLIRAAVAAGEPAPNIQASPHAVTRLGR